VRLQGLAQCRLRPDQQGCAVGGAVDQVQTGSPAATPRETHSSGDGAAVRLFDFAKNPQE